jgi:drug/metabolite transporter (DMT)-like permease
LVFIWLSAILFGVSPPLAKILVRDLPPVTLAGLLYLGAFLGLSIYSIGRNILFNNRRTERAALTKGDFPWLCGAIISGGMIAPISLMFGLRHVSGFAASLLLNLEGVSTAVIAVSLFRESAGSRLWWAMGCMTLAGVFLTWEPSQGTFNLAGTALICIAMVAWGLDNNLTRHISARDPIQIALIKGLVAGATSLSLAYVLGMGIPWNVNISLALLLGSFSYGISLVFFIKALEGLGSFRTGVFFSLAPFIGAVISLILLQEWIGWVMFPATGLMVAGLWLMIEEKHSHLHVHEEMTHTHLHTHDDIHHRHDHDEALIEPHSHEHVHREEAHAHAHWPDTHHRHAHDS